MRQFSSSWDCSFVSSVGVSASADTLIPHASQLNTCKPAEHTATAVVIDKWTRNTPVVECNQLLISAVP